MLSLIAATAIFSGSLWVTTDGPAPSDPPAAPNDGTKISTKTVNLTFDMNYSGGSATLISGWPTIMIDDSAPLSPTTHSLGVSLSGRPFGAVDQQGNVSLAIVLHLDYSPNALLGTYDQDVSLTLDTYGLARIWDGAPFWNPKGRADYVTKNFFFDTGQAHSISVALIGNLNPPPAPYRPDETVWFDGALPDGAQPHADAEFPFDFNFRAMGGDQNPRGLPLPPGCPPNATSLQVDWSSPQQDGTTQHYFDGAAQTLVVGQYERLFTYIYIPTQNWAHLKEIMLQWNDGTWEHRAFWGADIIPWGVTGTVSRRWMGQLPPPDVWTRLEVFASDVGLEGRTVNGMAFTVNGSGIVEDQDIPPSSPNRDGRRFDCYWSRAGKLQATLPASKTTVPDVLEVNRPVAENVIRAAGLVPKITGASASGAWVSTESPHSGVIVDRGSNVTLQLKTGPKPNDGDRNPVDRNSRPQP